jgi:hypothetical protein
VSVEEVPTVDDSGQQRRRRRTEQALQSSAGKDFVPPAAGSVTSTTGGSTNGAAAARIHVAPSTALLSGPESVPVLPSADESRAARQQQASYFLRGLRDSLPGVQLGGARAHTTHR